MRDKCDPGTIDLFDYDAALVARDAGMAKVLEDEDDFKIEFARFIDNLPHGWIGTCEDIRHRWSGTRPHHHNCWGAAWGAAKRRGVLVELAEQAPMTAVKSHARKTHLHRRV
jgi:hypothetical protein